MDGSAPPPPSGFERRRVANPVRPRAWELLAVSWVVGFMSSVGILAGLHAAGLGMPPTGVTLALPFLAAFAVYRLLGLAWPRHLVLERRGDRVRGAGRHVLSVGRGEIRMRATRRRAPKGGSFLAWEAFHSPTGAAVRVPGDVPLFRLACPDQGRARAFAEALCALGGYPLRWIGPDGGPGEVRRPHELDVPLGERLRSAEAGAAAALEARDPEGAAPAPPPSGTRTEVRLGPGGELLLGARPVPRGKLLGAIRFNVMTFAAFLALGLASERFGGGPWFHAAVAVGLVLFVALVYLASVLLIASVRHEYEVTTGGVRARRRFLGLPAGGWWVPAGEIESIYVVDDQLRERFELVGDRRRRAMWLGMAMPPAEKAYLKALLERGLAGAAEEPTSTTSRSEERRGRFEPR